MELQEIINTAKVRYLNEPENLNSTSSNPPVALLSAHCLCKCRCFQARALISAKMPRFRKESFDRNHRSRNCEKVASHACDNRKLMLMGLK